MVWSFSDKVALVTGAASGIGLATAKAFAEVGAAVSLADLHEDAARSAAEQLVAGQRAIAVRCNVADEADVAAMVEQTVSTFGRLDAAANNAGVQSPAVETADASGEEFNRECDQSPRRLELHEVRAAPDARARKRRDRKLLLDRRPDRYSGPSNLSCVQTRSDRADEECYARAPGATP